jgi:toxin ParE1/3/4
VDYIAAEHPDTAAKWLDGLMELAERLPRFPRRGRIVSEVGRSAIREVLYRRHRIIYRVDRKQISIVTVRHQRRRFTADNLERD